MRQLLTLTCEECQESFTVPRKRGLVRRFCDRCRVLRDKRRRKLRVQP
jgi:hypothetical protein